MFPYVTVKKHHFGQKSGVFSRWRANQEWRSITVDTVVYILIYIARDNLFSQPLPYMAQKKIESVFLSAHNQRQ